MAGTEAAGLEELLLAAARGVVALLAGAVALLAAGETAGLILVVLFEIAGAFAGATGVD